MVYCKKCGKNSLKGRFCSACGTELVKNLVIKRYLIWSVAFVIFFVIIIEITAFSQSIDAENIFWDIKKGTMILMGTEFCGDSKCNPDEIYICKKDCVWCGDGNCQKEEIGNCYDDCEWCGDGYCQSSENCDSCSKDCGNCKAAAYCGDRVCNAGECALGCYKDCLISQCENGVCESQKGENCVTSPNDCRCKLNERCNREIKSCEVIFCGNGMCDNGENSLTCPNDCKEDYKEVLTDPNKDYSIIFVHGHNPKEVKGYNPTELEEFQKSLVKEGYENKGYILPRDYPPTSTKGIWSGKRVAVIMTYYANKYDNWGGVVGPDDNQHISVYAQRLRDVIELVKHNTGKNKVIIIAHSMGGLVSRAYIKYYGGIYSVDKLIMIGTPNHGTEGLIVKDLCGTIHPGPECEEMKKGSQFLGELNSGDETPGSIKYLTIIGRNIKKDFCLDEGYWDNVVCASSVYLEGAENYYYNDFSEGYYTYNPLKNPTSNSLHTAMVKPPKAPEVYNKIINFIKE